MNKFYILELASRGTPVFTTRSDGTRYASANESIMGWFDEIDSSNDRQVYVVKYLLENVF